MTDRSEPTPEMIEAAAAALDNIMCDGWCNAGPLPKMLAEILAGKIVRAALADYNKVTQPASPKVDAEQSPAHPEGTRRSEATTGGVVPRRLRADQLWSHSSDEGEEWLLIRLKRSRNTRTPENPPLCKPCRLEAAADFDVALSLESPPLAQESVTGLEEWSKRIANGVSQSIARDRP